MYCFNNQDELPKLHMYNGCVESYGLVAVAKLSKLFQNLDQSYLDF